MEPAKSRDEINQRLARLVEASKTDKKLRQALLQDPNPVLAAHGIPLAPGLRIRFVEANPSEIVLPLPKYEGPA
ncbi:MAG TPA: hypothetical protein VN822_01650 [Candidatus Acidoferrales bacterium]|nr:hypothetical protein [Candidatus Acidoferrales bacterium]